MGGNQAHKVLCIVVCRFIDLSPTRLKGFRDESRAVAPYSRTIMDAMTSLPSVLTPWHRPVVDTPRGQARCVTGNWRCRSAVLRSSAHRRRRYRRSEAQTRGA
jgi:hypothetical protein